MEMKKGIKLGIAEREGQLLIRIRIFESFILIVDEYITYRSKHVNKTVLKVLRRLIYLMSKKMDISDINIEIDAEVGYVFNSLEDIENDLLNHGVDSIITSHENMSMKTNNKGFVKSLLNRHIVFRGIKERIKQFIPDRRSKWEK